MGLIRPKLLDSQIVVESRKRVKPCQLGTLREHAHPLQTHCFTVKYFVNVRILPENEGKWRLRISAKYYEGGLVLPLRR